MSTTPSTDTCFAGSAGRRFLNNSALATTARLQFTRSMVTVAALLTSQMPTAFHADTVDATARFVKLAISQTQ